MSPCEVCGCPSSGERTRCAWCDTPLERPGATAFVVERNGDRVEWLTDGTLVASACLVHGLWQITDAQGRQVVTLMPLAGVDDPPSTALIGPTARLLGTISRDGDGVRLGASARDERGQTVLTLRGEGPTASRVVDRRGEVVALCSRDGREGRDGPDGATDLLVTSSGARQPLAMVFGLVLAAELDREPGRYSA